MKIPTEFKSFTCSVSICSRDKTNKKSLIISEEKIANFDSIKKKFFKKIKLPYEPASADGLFIDNRGLYILTEFKSGSVNESNILEKIYDSAFISMATKRASPNWLRKNTAFILVYSDENETVKARHELFSKGSKKSDDPVYFYISEKAPKYIYNFITEMTAEQFIREYMNVLPKYSKSRNRDVHKA